MSSMFKKKGGPAFKPKFPPRRPAGPALSQPKPAPPPPPQVPVAEPEPQSEPQGASEKPLTEKSTVEPVEAQSQDSHQAPRQKSPTPPATIPDPPEPSQNVATQEPPLALASQEIPHEPDTQIGETRIEEAPITATTETTSQSSAPVPAPTSIPEPTQTPVAESATPQADATQTEDADNTPSAVLQAPTPDDSEAPSGTEPSTTPSADATESTSTPSTEAQNPPKPTRKPRARKQAPQATQDGTGADGETARPKKRQRKPAEEGAAPKEPRKRRAPAQNGTAAPRNRRARSITPEDSESQVVDLQKLKMSDLTRDLHIGKKFSRHDELRERERRARLKSKLGTEGSRDSSATPEASGQGEKTGSPVTQSGDASPASSGPAPPSGPQFRIVDGQIVVDQSSLTVDRHARAAAARGDMEIVEENDFTRLITSNSFMNTSKLRGPNIWTDAETELFYRGLRMFGTDFEMISKMFPGKQRRHVKLKYNREERHCPRRIDAALVGEKTVKMDLDEYKAFTGSEFEPVENIEAEQRKIQEEYEAEQKRIADEQAEIMRKKREELFKDDDEGDAKKRKKKKRQTIVYGLNGEPITQDD
ncbi:SANT domain-containing protein [Fusarium falciforme]|uniref:SANT domain-containing protein n=1 Tax=Fusarium falciforme TaxID=195108 RepID=UPI00230005C2|nr:SANT domain-containing protein [Fusarium falciforme]WAO88419.1 SANT domain-containing protein [Fusarium falciforme]